MNKWLLWFGLVLGVGMILLASSLRAIADKKVTTAVYVGQDQIQLWQETNHHLDEITQEMRQMNRTLERCKTVP